jgi:hypothetical protein
MKNKINIALLILPVSTFLVLLFCIYYYAFTGIDLMRGENGWLALFAGGLASLFPLLVFGNLDY